MSTRRSFLVQTAAAGVIAATEVGTVKATSKVTPGDCPDIKTPLKDVAGKVAFITGGSSGIGLGIARAFVDAGMKVVLTYRTQGHIDEAMSYFKGAEDRVHTISVDVTDRPAMEKAAQESIEVFGKVHVLVNNAGVFVTAPLSSNTFDDWDWVIGVNLTGVFNGVRTFLPRLQSHGEGGQIITTSSVLGLFVVGGLGAYSPTKFALVGMTEALRSELAHTNIGVSVFCSGVVASRGAESARNRPKTLADTGAKTDPKQIALALEAQKDRRVAMDPLEAGQLVLKGMRNNDLYILPPGFEQVVQERHEALMASFPKDFPPAGMHGAAPPGFGNPMYIEERNYQRCIRASSRRKA